MATTTENIDVNVNVNSGPLSSSLKDLKKELIELKSHNLEVLSSEKQKEIINRMGLVKGKIDDLNYSLKNFDPGDTFGNLATALRPVATGFAVVTQAQMVLGVESEKVQKLQQQVTAAISAGMALQDLADINRLKSIYVWLATKPKELILDGLSLVIKKATVVATNQEAAGTLKVAVAKKVATAAQWLWNAAMSANPIGLFIIALAALATGIYFVAKAFRKSGEDMKVNAEAVKNLKEKQKDYLRSIQEARLQHLKNIGKLTDREVQIEMLKLDTIAAMNAVRDKMREDIAKNPQNIKTLTRLADEEVALIIRVHSAKYLALITAKKEEKKVIEKSGKDTIDAEKNINDLTLNNMEDGLDKEIALAKSKAEEDKKKVTGTKEQKKRQIEEIEKGLQIELDKIRKKYSDKEEARIRKQSAEEIEIWEKSQKVINGEISVIDDLKNQLKKLETAQENNIFLTGKEDVAVRQQIVQIRSQINEYEKLLKKKNEVNDSDPVNYTPINFDVKGELDKLPKLTIEQQIQKLTGLNEEDVKKGLQQLAAIGLDTIGQLLTDSLSNSVQSQVQSLYDEVDKFEETQGNSLENLRKRNLITEAEYNSRKEALDKQVEAKTKAAKKKAFELEKEENLKKITISTALAVAKSIAVSPETFGLPFSAYAIAEGLSQAIIVKAQKPPAYAKGHLFNDETYYKNSIVGEAGPEALMSNRATEKYFNLLSSLNTSVGGNSFGGNNNVNELNILNAQMERLIDLTTKQKIVLSVQSLNQVQKDLNRLEATATLT